MVRLKAGLEEEGVTGYTEFQFQNGTIKSSHFPHRKNEVYEVSIPKWYD